MTTLQGRDRRALVVVDVQVGVVARAFERDTVLDTIRSVVRDARSHDLPVVWVQHHDDHLLRHSDEWQWVDGLGPRADEPLVEKSYGDAFADTRLETVLADRSVGEIVLIGAASEQCIRCTLHSAVVRGYDVALVKGAHTTEDLTEYGMPEPRTVVGFIDSIAEYGMRWPGRSGRLIEPSEVGG